ncbi:endospore germination permease [Bacillus sp. 31A1R]|uniref:Endospore germination permease n=1 Tax=Robertmurraya mangrovi TaxID=3098077 RepID=A0ABU5J3U6_9BACI|nr:endospore germination permease [Bacillus sp. 31A1R]MDZ5474040.1 endospore germination permease [Bacillus sp. 31A1R]
MKNNLVEKVSLFQLFILIYIFELGSAVVVGIGGEAKQDAWIAECIGTVCGVGITGFYVYILKKLPGKNLFEILIFTFGKWIGRAVIFLYIVYFFYIAARVLRDFCELMSSTIFEKTPIEVIALTMMMVIVYMIYLGLEVMGRTSEIFIPYIFSFALIIGLLVFLTGEIEFNNLLPIFGEGFGPILKVVFPGFITFPYGEMIAFTLIIPYATKFANAGKTSMIAVLASGITLVYTMILQLTTLGPEMRERANFPTLSAAREISLLDFIERVDLVVVFIVMFGIIVKVSVFFFGGLKGLEIIFNRPYRTMVVPMGAIIAFITIVISENYAEHIQEGVKVVPMYLHIPFQFLFPLTLLPFLIYKIKKQQKEKQQ